MDCQLFNITDPITNITIEDYICECGRTCHMYLDIIIYFFITIFLMYCYYRCIIAPHIHRYVLHTNDDENIERGENNLPKYSSLYPTEVDAKHL